MNVPPNLTPAQIERLALLAEELGECQHIIGKILRHGLNSTNPTTSDGMTNRDMLERELGDVKAAVHLLVENSDISIALIDHYSAEKLNRVGRYLHHQGVRP